MSQIVLEEFLSFLADALMYDEEPLAADQPFPPLVFDSTGKLMVAAAVEAKYGLALSLDELINCKTPGDVYELVRKHG
jgi:phosphopantetheine attachment domain protein